MSESTHFRQICADHITRLANKSFAQPSANSWMREHINAWNGEPNRGRPTLGERAIRDGILSFAAMCDAHRLPGYEPGDAELGDDIYFKEHAEDIVNALLSYLNFDCGRFDCGTLDRLIRKLASEAHVEIP